MQQHYTMLLVLPQIVPFNFGEDEINAMDMVSASCTVNKGDLPLKITWMRNNQSIYSNDGISISRTNQRISILSIDSVRDRHAGNYQCIASNSGGSVNYTASLWVNGTLQSTTTSIIPHKIQLISDVLFCFEFSLIYGIYSFLLVPFQ